MMMTAATPEEAFSVNPSHPINIDIAISARYDAIMKTQRCVMSRLSLPARSLRGRPASLRTVPDGAGCLLRKQLIWQALLVIRPAISGVEPIFLPALRERGKGGARWRSRIENEIITNTAVFRPEIGRRSGTISVAYELKPP